MQKTFQIIKTFTIALILMHSHLLFSQKKVSQTIRGIIIDKDSKTTLPGVNIILLNSNPLIGAASDENGEFEIKNISPGLHHIRATLVGYHPVEIHNIELKSAKEIVLTVEMEEQVITVNQVVITAEIQKNEALNKMAAVSARSFTVEETERYAGTWLDPSRMAANYAGVMAVGDQRNDIIIRGNSPLGLLWKLEGVDIPNPNHFGTLGTTGGPISILNNNVLDNSDFFTGAFPAEYGNATSGVFDLKLRSGNNQQKEYTLQFGMNGLEVGAEGPFSKKSNASYLINYRYSTMKIFDVIGLNFGVSGVPQYQDISFKINIPGKKSGKFSIFGVGGISHMDVLYKDKDEDDWSFGKGNIDFRFGSDMGVAGVSWLHFFKNNARLKTIFAISGSQATASADSAYTNKQSFNYYGNRSFETKYSFVTKYSKKLNAKNNYNIGLSYDLFDVFYSDSVLMPELTFQSITKTEGKNMGLLQSYFQFQHKLSDDLKFYGGFHFQYFSLNSSKALEPRLSIKWNFANNHYLSMGGGVHSQLQPRLFYFLETTLDNGNSILTNHNLGFSKSNQLVVAYDYLINKNLRFKFETYYQYLYNIPVEQKPSYYSIINYGTDFFGTRMDSLENKGTGNNYGVEFTLEKFMSKNYYFLITTSLFQSHYKGSDGIIRNTIYNGNYVNNFLAGYQIDIGKYNSLKLDIKTVVAGGQHYIPIDLEKSRIAGKEIYDFSEAYSPSYNDYFRLDARLHFRLNRSKFNTEISFDVQNITKQKNILLETFDVASGNIRYDYQLGLFYVVLLRFQF